MEEVCVQGEIPQCARVLDIVTDSLQVGTGGCEFKRIGLLPTIVPRSGHCDYVSRGVFIGLLGGVLISLDLIDEGHLLGRHEGCDKLEIAIVFIALASNLSIQTDCVLWPFQLILDCDTVLCHGVVEFKSDGLKAREWTHELEGFLQTVGIHAEFVCDLHAPSGRPLDKRRGLHTLEVGSVMFVPDGQLGVHIRSSDEGVDVKLTVGSRGNEASIKVIHSLLLKHLNLCALLDRVVVVAVHPGDLVLPVVLEWSSDLQVSVVIQVVARPGVVHVEVHSDLLVVCPGELSIAVALATSVNVGGLEDDLLEVTEGAGHGDAALHPGKFCQAGHGKAHVVLVERTLRVGSEGGALNGVVQVIPDTADGSEGSIQLGKDVDATPAIAQVQGEVSINLASRSPGELSGGGDLRGIAVVLERGRNFFELGKGGSECEVSFVAGG